MRQFIGGFLLALVGMGWMVMTAREAPWVLGGFTEWYHTLPDTFWRNYIIVWIPLLRIALAFFFSGWLIFKGLTMHMSAPIVGDRYKIWVVCIVMCVLAAINWRNPISSHPLIFWPMNIAVMFTVLFGLMVLFALTYPAWTKHFLAAHFPKILAWIKEHDAKT